MNRPLSRRDWLRISAAAAAVMTASRGNALWSQDRPSAAAVDTSKLLVRSENPFNAEPPLADLVAEEVTPTEQFFIRSHGPTPKVDAKSYSLSVEGLVNKPLTLSLDEVQAKFAPHTLTASLTCAGNRRVEMARLKPISGVQWDAGAIGNATWTGAALAEILKAAGIQPGAKHVWFEGLDPIPEKDGSEAPFGGSIPLDRALGTTPPQGAGAKPAPGAIVAYAMNDAPLTADHGYPLRTVVPGFIGARSVKWLAKIVVSDRTSPNHYVAEAYKVVTEGTAEEVARAEPIYEMPLNSAICLPAAGAKVAAGLVHVAGYALPSGKPGATIRGVELSTDGGKTWHDAKLRGEEIPGCWRLWEVRPTITPGKHTLVVRATDSTGQVQPREFPWNLKGYLYSAWHRCEVEAA
jgi:sulfite oxidase